MYGETLTVDNLGRIYINGVKVQAIGLHLEHSTTLPSYEIADSMLQDLEDANIRFIAINFPYWMSNSQISQHIDFWFPLLYEHRMWVQVQPQHAGLPQPTLTTAAQMPKQQLIINDISANTVWCEMVFSWAMAWELDNYWEEDSFTDAEVDTYLTDFVPTLKASLAASNVGDVPLFGKAQSPYDNYRGGYPMGEHADIAGMDYYFSVSGSSWASVVQTRFNQFYNDYCPATGHSGQAYWSTEMGIQSGDLQEEWTPSLLTQILNGMGGEFALGMFWNMWNPTTSGQGTWSAFDPSGNMKDWFNGLLPVITPLI